MRCPLCEVTMKEVERRGVLIDVCPECRGIWLDRGELDKLLSTADFDESEAHPEGEERREIHREGDHKEKWEKERGKQKRRRGLLGEIFDFDLFD